VPVISSIIGGTTDMIEHEADGLLIEAGHDEAWAQALIDLAQDEAKRRALGRAARARAVREFDCRAVAAKLLPRFRAAVDAERANHG